MLSYVLASTTQLLCSSTSWLLDGAIMNVFLRGDRGSKARRPIKRSGQYQDTEQLKLKPQNSAGECPTQGETQLSLKVIITCCLRAGARSRRPGACRENEDACLIRETSRNSNGACFLAVLEHARNLSWRNRLDSYHLGN